MKTYENTLNTILNELLEKNADKKLIIWGCRRISAVIYCALRYMGTNVAYFIDPDMKENVDERLFFGHHVYPPHWLLYEDPEDIAVINSLHYKEKFDPVMKKFGLEENKNYFNLNGYQKVKHWNSFDPLLGYARKGDRGSFHIHGIEKESAVRIVTVGGATTDYCYSEIKSWPEYLNEILQKNGIDNVVFNGGLNGYTSCEERDMVLRDALLLKPDIIISLSGECDIDWLMVSNSYPWYSQYFAKKMKGLHKRNAKKHQKIWLDREDVPKSDTPNITDFENWMKNERIIYAVSKKFGVKFYGFLQPFIMCGHYNMSDFEKGWMDRFLSEGVKEISTIEKIFNGAQSFYKGAGKLVEEYDFMYDLTNVFDNVSGVYGDGVHYDEAGNYIIAEAISKCVFGRKGL